MRSDFCLELNLSLPLFLLLKFTNGFFNLNPNARLPFQLCMYIFQIITQYLLMYLETGHSLGYVVPVGATIGTHMCAYAFVSVCTHACIWWFADFDIRWYTHAHA